MLLLTQKAALLIFPIRGHEYERDHHVIFSSKLALIKAVAPPRLASRMRTPLFLLHVMD